MLDTVFTTISRYNMLAAGDRMIVAVSGGADSVCLLEVMAALAPRLEIILAGVAHFNHKLRGEESEKDEQFVAALAARHGIPLYRTEAAFSKATNLEQEARRARLDFFRALIGAGRAQRVAVAHTRDDQAETVLLRLTRGSGLAGLAGILPVTREGVIRPLIESTRAEVETYLRGRGIAWRDDSSNQDLRFRRNRVRHQLLPSLACDYNPAISESLAQMAELARDEEAWWSAEIARLAENLLVIGPAGVEVRAADLAALPKAVARRLARKALGLAKGDLRRLEFDHVEQMLALAASQSGTGRTRLPGLTVTRSLDWLHVHANRAETPILPISVQVPGSYHWSPTNSQITLEIAERKGPWHPNRTPGPYATLEVELCWKRVRGPLELRGWRSGDTYWPQGRSRVYPLSDLFQEFRVPSWRRLSWPILSCRTASGQTEILWAKEFGGAHELVTEADAGPVLRISEKQESFASRIASY